MSYRFQLQEPIAQGVRRVGLEQIEMAETKLASDEDAPSAIHDARRCLKRLRALVRLVRPALDETAYRRETKRLAGIGRLLADARDAHVMQQTLGKLESRYGAMPGAGGERLRNLLAGGRSRGRRQAVAGEKRQVLQRLLQARRLFTGKALEKIELEHVVDGLERAYGKARKAFRTAYDRPSDESFHAWRKTVQLHWRHMLLLSRGWPEALSARASEAKELSRLLGEDHDYSILLAFAQDRGGASLEPEALASLGAMCRSSQSELREEARPRGERLLAEPAGDLCERMTLYWGSATRLAVLPRPEQKPAARQPARSLKKPRRRGA